MAMMPRERIAMAPGRLAFVGAPVGPGESVASTDAVAPCCTWTVACQLAYPGWVRSTICEPAVTDGMVSGDMPI